MLSKRIVLTLYCSLFFLIGSFHFSAIAQEALLKEIDRYIETVQKDWETPGFAVAIVKDDKVIFAKGYDAAGNIGTLPSTEVEVLDQTDTTPPTLTLLYPSAGSTITGIVNVVVDATDNVAVDSVQFFVDGILEATDFDEPWGFSWNTAPLDSGSIHTLYMKGFDPSGNVGTAGPTSFTITN